MKEAQIKDRLSDLGKTVKRALHHMQTDGLVLQLEGHRASSQFAPRRLGEVLRDFIDAGREKYIQKLRHEIDNAAFERDRSELKLRQLRLEHSQRQKVIIRENKALAEARGSLSAQVAEAQSELPRMTARYERAMAACDKRIRRSHILLAQIKANLESLSTDLTDVRADVSLQSVSQMRLIRTQLNRIRSQAEKEAAHQREMAEHQTARIVSHKEAEIARLEKRSIEFANSRQVLTKFFNDLALTAGIPDRCDEPSSFGAVFSEVLAAEGQAALKQHIREAGITTPVHLYIQSVREQCDRSLRAKEEELDNIIAQSRKRRRKLQDELDAALAKLRSLQGSQSFPSSDEMFDEIDHSSHDFDTSARQLDATMQRLRRALGKA